MRYTVVGFWVDTQQVYLDDFNVDTPQLAICAAREKTQDDSDLDEPQLIIVDVLTVRDGEIESCLPNSCLISRRVYPDTDLDACDDDDDTAL